MQVEYPKRSHCQVATRSRDYRKVHAAHLLPRTGRNSRSFRTAQDERHSGFPAMSRRSGVARTARARRPKYPPKPTRRLGPGFSRESSVSLFMTLPSRKVASRLTDYKPGQETVIIASRQALAVKRRPVNTVPRCKAFTYRKLATVIFARVRVVYYTWRTYDLHAESRLGISTIVHPGCTTEVLAVRASYARGSRIISPTAAL